jgi:hypothetical protein
MIGSTGCLVLMVFVAFVIGSSDDAIDSAATVSD